MKKESKDFISVYSDVFEDGFCAHLISEFERLTSSGAGSDRMVSEGMPRHRKDDMQIPLNLKTHSLENFNGEYTPNVFFRGLQECFKDYSSDFSVLNDMTLKATDIKMQRTYPGQGYHVWHGEQSSLATAARALVYSVYLNTLSPEEAGETEFLYQQRRIRPVENTVVLWPASFTHAHRGNTVFGNTTKYIITGWFYIQE